KRLQSHSKIFGEFPIVVMSPEDYKITTGGPSERRRFIDVLLSQVSISYLTNLQEYYRILKQRNKILQNMKEGVRVNDTALIPWTENLINCGSKIVRDRHKFAKNFLTYFAPIYKEYSESDDEIDMSLDSIIAANEVGENIEEERFKSELEKYRLKEKRLGMSLIGPHRDDISFTINGKDIRTYGSRGEHKSVLISLKIAEFNFLREAKEEAPIFLLDDYYSELDDLREERVFLSLEELGQVFLTSPKKQVLTEHSKYFDRFGDIRQFQIEGGEIELFRQ
ncbi:DNA replication/repair protein RecF, partial [candidate division KSB1 bacterium]|nr:DNA replication/repair protein RecF [candidate division KSB1 bacterium]NIR72476.1 DNA replication/repair protein RecF [candidate division KSB1 bacterium]NIS24061.1 DNA replication/repair protein RecF [candidate division KSB1 bacterium]NIT70980.1 DNA replication/repair protein RecF [candidate division KSB1 bacterium]NIU27391.1 DNA replication/repair protein RecF [candidate division KSB1 bacterium]